MKLLQKIARHFGYELIPYSDYAFMEMQLEQHAGLRRCAYEAYREYRRDNPEAFEDEDIFGEVASTAPAVHRLIDYLP